MQELVIASNNAGKIREIRSMIDNIHLLSLKDIGFSGDIPEPYDTFEQNAHTKADTIHKFSGKNVFADDSGICVPALGGAPGVFSARYAGMGASDEDNLQKLLAETTIPNKSGQAPGNKSAFYKAVICLIWNEQTYYFEGVCNGRLLDKKQGTGGFGYDPIFVPDGYDQTFAELPLDIKNNISHRGKAVRAMIAFLKEKTSQ